MTREQAKRRAELYSALAAGKIIQVQNPETGKWEYLDLNKFDGFMEEYNFRIKPEPEYRPFKTKEECWDEMSKHQPFGWVISKKSASYVNLGSITQHNNNVEITFSTNEGEHFSTERLFNNYTFADGTPFGSKLPTNL